MLVKDPRYVRMESVKEKEKLVIQDCRLRKKRMKTQIEQNITTYFEFLHSQFCQPRISHCHPLIRNLDRFRQHLPVADS